VAEGVCPTAGGEIPLSRYVISHLLAN